MAIKLVVMISRTEYISELEGEVFRREQGSQTEMLHVVSIILRVSSNCCPPVM